MIEKRFTYSKLIILISYICAIALSIVVVYGAINSIDMPYVASVAALAWAEVAASNVFYYKKAERENLIKISLGLAKELGKDIDLDQILSRL